VSDLCLADNYHQSACISQDERRSRVHAAPFVQLIESRVAAGMLSAREEGVPVGEELEACLAEHGGLLRPTLCTLLGYEKMRLEQAIAGSPLVAMEGIDHYLAAYFPAPFVRRYGDLLDRHPLRAEIIATVAVNKIVNQAGVTFFSEAEEDTGSPPWEVAHAYLVAERILDADSCRTWLMQLDNKIEAGVQYDILLEQEELLAELTRRLLNRSPAQRPSFPEISAYRHHVRAFEASCTGPNHAARVATLRRSGVPAPLAQHVARLGPLRGIFEVVDIHQAMGTPFVAIGQCLAGVGEAVAIDELRYRLAHLAVDGEWQAEAQEGLLEEVSVIRYRLVTEVLRRRTSSQSVAAAVAQFLEERSEPLHAFRERLAALMESERPDPVMFAVVLHQLRQLLPA
jgi:glutamate dehydrogenase